MKKMLTMKQGEKRAKEKERRKKIDKLCCRSALLLSVVSCIALIHVELRIQEHHQLISQSVTSCDHMEAKILQKLQPQGHKDSQGNGESHSEGHWQKARGIKWRQFLFLLHCIFLLLSNLRLICHLYKTFLFIPPPSP